MQQSAKGERARHAGTGVTEGFTTLLSAVIGYAELVRVSVEPEHEVHQYLSGIMGSAAHALSLAGPSTAHPQGEAPDGEMEELESVLSELEQESESLRKLVERMQSSRGPKPPEPNGRGRILIVHRDPCIRGAYASTLEGQGFCVWQEESGWDAVQAFAANADGVDLLITEADMPMLGGEDVAWILHTANPNLNVLLIASTEEPQSGTPRRSQGQYLKDPYSLRTLVTAVEQLTRR